MAGEGEKGEKEDNSWQSGEGWCGAGVDSLLPENEKSLNSSSWKILNRKVLLWQACLCWVAAFDKCDTAKDLMWAPPFWRCNHFFDLLRSHLIFSACPMPWHVKIAPRARFHMRGLITQSMCQALEWWWFHIALLHLLWRAWLSVRRSGNFGPLQIPSKSSVSIDQVITCNLDIKLKKYDEYDKFDKYDRMMRGEYDNMIIVTPASPAS